MSNSESETLFDEPILSSRAKLGKRAQEWVNKLAHAQALKTKVSKFKAGGLTRDQIAEVEPEYYYDEDYHIVSSQGVRRSKTMTDVHSAIGTSQGYSAWEWCGEKS